MRRRDPRHPDVHKSAKAAACLEQRGAWLLFVPTYSSDLNPYLEFMDLFTKTEQRVLVEASMTFPAVKLWYDRAVGVTFIDLDAPRTEPGLQKLVDENLIAPER